MFITNLGYWINIGNLASSILTSAFKHLFYHRRSLKWKYLKTRGFRHLQLDWNWHLKVHLGVCVCTLFSVFWLSVYFTFAVSFLPQPSFKPNSEGSDFTPSISGLRVIVQKIEPNHSVFDQASCAILHAWPCSLLTHNLSKEAFFICIHTVT